MRMIDADELKKQFSNEPYGPEEIRSIIDKTPTVEARPQGEWKIIRHDDHYLMGIYQCNLCSYKYPCPDEFARNFCPNCGADMRKPNCVTCVHFGKCEGCEKRDEE